MQEKNEVLEVAVAAENKKMYYLLQYLAERIGIYNHSYPETQVKFVNDGHNFNGHKRIHLLGQNNLPPEEMAEIKFFNKRRHFVYRSFTIAQSKDEAEGFFVIFFETYHPFGPSATLYDPKESLRYAYYSEEDCTPAEQIYYHYKNGDTDRTVMHAPLWQLGDDLFEFLVHARDIDDKTLRSSELKNYRYSPEIKDFRSPESLDYLEI